MVLVSILSCSSDLVMFAIKGKMVLNLENSAGRQLGQLQANHLSNSTKVDHVNVLKTNRN